MVIQCLSFFKEAASNAYILRMCSKVCVLEIDLEYPKELCELHNDYPLAPDEIEIKREIPPSYQLRIANLYNIPIGTVKKLVPNFFEKEKHALHYENLQLNLRLGLKLKKIHQVLEFNHSHWVIPYVEFNTYKRVESEKHGDKDGKVLHKNNAACCKAIKNLRKRVDVKLVSNKQEYLIMI